MRYMKFGLIAIVFSLLAISLYGQEVVVKIKPYDGTAATFVNKQIVADTVASGGLLATHVYEFARDQIYLHNAIFTVPNGKTLRLRAEAGTGKKPVIYLWETGTGTTPTRPPGNFVVLNGGNLEIKNICIAGYYEFEPDRVDGVQGGLINTTAAGSSIILDGVVLSNINGQHVRTGFNTVKVKVTNSIFANMGALTTSNLGAGKGIDLREAACDSFIVVNNTFVNYQDRAIRHYNFANPAAGTGLINYGRIEHNTFINGMGFHGLFSLGNVGPEIIITNNLFVDAFALGEDSTDATRAAEWANTGEFYPNGRSRITWIFTAPNTTTQWTVSNNYYAISDSGWAFLNSFGYPPGSPLSYHINSRLGADSVNAFTQTTLALANIPRLMTNMMRWYESPTGGNRTKNTPSASFNRITDDYDRRPIEYYRDVLAASYSTASAAYTGAQRGFPVGDLNWFPDKKAEWEKGPVGITITVDGNKDPFYETLTGPNDGYLQIRSYAWNTNGVPDNDADLSAKLWTGWDETYLYVYEEVKDDVVHLNNSTSYQNDVLEIYFDPDPSATVTTAQLGFSITALDTPDVAQAYWPGITNLTGYNVTTGAKPEDYARRRTNDGYVLECRVKWGVLKDATRAITPAVGNIFGMATMNHDNDVSTREASVSWAAVMNDNVWNTPANHGTVTFLADNKLKFVATSTRSGVVNPIPYDGSDYMRTDIVVDAKKDVFYSALTGPNNGYLQLKSYAFNENGIPTGDADLSANVWTAWDKNWLYLYEEVKDDTLSGNATNVWEEDEIELKIDPQPTDSTQTSTFEVRLTALGKGTAGVVAADSINNLPDSLKQWARAKISGGYALELALKWSAIKNGTETITPAVGTVFGMAINQHDNDGKARRQASVQWAAVMSDAVWNTPKYCGTVELLDNGKMKYIPKNNMTGRTNPTPYDGTPFYMRIDGKKDPFYYSLKKPNNGYLQIRSYAWNDNGAPVDDADLSAKVWTAWDDKWFYLYEEVKDDTLAGNATNVWEEDCIELKFDPQATDSVINSVWDTRFTALSKREKGVAAADSLNNVADSLKQWTRTKITGGYALEMAIKWSAIKSSNNEIIMPATNNVFGMAICQHDNDGKARRQASVMWGAVMKDAVWNTPKYHGTVKFAANNQLQFIPKNNMTGVTNVIPYDGSEYTRVGVVEEMPELPKVFSLEQNYPNPFNPSTKIIFNLEQVGHATLTVFNMLGQIVATPVDAKLASGYHEIIFDASHLANGIYFYKLEAGDKVSVKKMLLLK